MASLIYNSAVTDEAIGDIDYDSDTFFVMLVTAGYTASKQAHQHRDEVIGFEVTGTNYTAGGQAAVVAVTEDSPNNRTNISLGGVVWPTSTITARGAVYYKNRGGDPSADNLVAYIDFGADVSSSNGSFTLSASNIQKQN